MLARWRITRSTSRSSARRESLAAAAPCSRGRFTRLETQHPLDGPTSEGSVRSSKGSASRTAATRVERP